MTVLVARGLPCPDCLSSDARAEYEDNYYCFSCKKSVLKEKKMWQPRMSHPTSKDVVLPPDCTTELAKPALAWLYQHYFTKELIERAGLLWSDSGRIYTFQGPRLIIPYAPNGTLQYFEARSFVEEPKYLTVGPKNQIYLTKQHQSDTLVIVEDMVSAIRIGELYNAVAIRGTACDLNRLNQVRTHGRDYILWFDSDIPGKMARYAYEPRLKLHGKVRTVKGADKDPKCYSNEEIKQFVEAAT